MRHDARGRESHDDARWRCATELCLMMGWVCGIVAKECELPSCRFWVCILRFLGVIGARCAFGGLSLYVFGARFTTCVG